MTRPYFCWLLSYVFFIFPSRACKQFISPFCFCQQFFSQDFSFPFPKHSGSVPITSIWHPLSWKKVVGHWKYVFRFILLSDQMTPECHRWARLIYCYLGSIHNLPRGWAMMILRGGGGHSFCLLWFRGAVENFQENYIEYRGANHSPRVERWRARWYSMASCYAVV